MKKIVLSVLLLGLIAGCSSVQQKPAPVVDSNAAGQSASDAARAAAQAAADKAAAEARALAEQRALAEKADPLNDPNSPLAQRSVYFAYDSSLVEDSYRPMLQAHAGYLSSHQATKVTIQGNTDDRGSREYNLALGQRRADSVRKVLNVMGVSESQMEAVSFGAEKPKAAGNDEAAWKENRRADLVYGQ